MIKAVIFDMDGLLVDSEPYWQQAQLDVLIALGVKITHQDTIDTTGIRIDQIVEDYYAKQPWQGPTADEVCLRIVNRVIDLVAEHKPVKSGVSHALSLCRESGLKIALASSSPMTLIQATLKALEISEWFEVIHSAEHLEYGKPHSEVYLNAAKSLGVSPLDCLALEDSFTGLLAAKAAQMKTVVVPEESQSEQTRWVIADHNLNSLDELTTEILTRL